jgi:hypothetical protein
MLGHRCTLFDLLFAVNRLSVSPWGRRVKNLQIQSYLISRPATDRDEIPKAVLVFWGQPSTDLHRNTLRSVIEEEIHYLQFDRPSLAFSVPVDDGKASFDACSPRNLGYK